MFFQNTFCLLLLAIVSCSANELFRWARLNGFYIHECLEYKNGGMFTTCDMEFGIDLVRIPKNMTFKGSSHENTSMMLMDFPDDHVLQPYVASLPRECQNPLCRPTNHSEVTNWGARLIAKRRKKHEHWPEEKSIWRSVVGSRTWGHGLTPIADLFNHHTKGMLLVERNNLYVVKNGATAAKSGEQIYDNYGLRSVWHGYTSYGFIDYSMNPKCDDMRLLRMKTHAKERSECVANGTWTFGEAVEEFNAAIRYEDFAMAKGLGKWIDNYIKIDTVAHIN